MKTNRAQGLSGIVALMVVGLMMTACGGKHEFAGVVTSQNGSILGSSDLSSKNDSETEQQAPQLPRATPTPQPQAPGQYMNIVAGTKEVCESSAREATGSNVICSVGGGCAMNGGLPSASNPSANPRAYGACVSLNVPTFYPIPRQYINIVAGTKAVCESTGAKVIGFKVTCSIGGGCAIGGEVPSQLHPSANPSAYGACVLTDRLVSGN